MTWTTPPKARSIACNADMLRFCRQRRGWTQERAADISGYSVRLIRKAEAGRPIHPDTIEILAETYTSADFPVFPEDLICDPRSLAQTILREYRQNERQVVSHVQRLLSEEMTCWVAGDVEHVPFAGEYEGIDGFDRFWSSLFALMERPDKTLYQPRIVADGNEVITMGRERVQLRGCEHPFEFWLTFRMVFHRGRLVRFEDFYDTHTGVDYLRENSALVKKLLHTKNATPHR